jgi:hypothetical protein
MLDANRCRQRAQQCRELAASIPDPSENERLILLAVEFDVQAAVIEWHAAVQQREEAARMALVS